MTCWFQLLHFWSHTIFYFLSHVYVYCSCSNCAVEPVRVGFPRHCSIISFRFNDDWNMLTSWCECFGRQKRNGKRYDDIHSCPLFHMENCELLNYHIWLLGVVMSCLHHCCVRSVTDSFINSIDWFVVLSHFNLEIHCFHSFFLTSTHFRLFSRVSTIFLVDKVRIFHSKGRNCSTKSF